MEIMRRMMNAGRKWNCRDNQAAWSQYTAHLGDQFARIFNMFQNLGAKNIIKSCIWKGNHRTVERNNIWDVVTFRIGLPR